MVFAYYGAAVGAGLAIMFLLAFSGFMLTLLIGELVYLVIFGLPVSEKKHSIGFILMALFCILPVLLAIRINPVFFIDHDIYSHPYFYYDFAFGISLGIVTWTVILIFKRK